MVKTLQLAGHTFLVLYFIWAIFLIPTILLIQPVLCGRIISGFISNKAPEQGALMES